MTMMGSKKARNRRATTGSEENPAPSGTKSSAAALAEYEKKIKRKLAGESQSGRAARNDRGALSSSMPINTSMRLDAYEEKIRSKTERENRSSSMPDVSELSTSDVGIEEFEKKVRQKLAKEGRRATTESIVGRDAADIKLKLEKERSENKNKSKGPSSEFDVRAANGAFDERLRRKVSQDKASSSSGVLWNQNRPTQINRSASLPITRSASASAANTNADEYFEAYEAKVRHRLEGESASGSNGNNNSNNNSKGKLPRPRHLSSSMPELLDSDTMFVSQVDKHKNKAPQKAKVQRGYTLQDVSIRDINKQEAGTATSSSSSIITNIKQEDYFDSTYNVDFKELFSDLQHFKQQNNGSLSIPVSNPAFNRIMDAFSAKGMEELLKKRWDYQLAGVKAFRREHGDCMIPASHPTLGRWTRVQRDMYRLYEQRLPSALTKKRYNKLKEVRGFDDFVNWKDEADEKEDSNDGDNDGDTDALLVSMVLSSRREQGQNTQVATRANSIRIDSVNDTRVSSESEENEKPDHDSDSDSDSNNVQTPITLDQKLHKRKMKKENKVKFVEGVSSKSSEKDDDDDDDDDNDSCDQTTITLDQKLHQRKMENKIKFMQRGIKAHSSSSSTSASTSSSSLSKSKSGRRLKDKEKVAAKLHEKRMLKRSIRAGLGRSQSRRAIVETLVEEEEEEEDSDNDGDENNSNNDEATTKEGSPTKSHNECLQRYGNLMRSCSASNLCPGSWECPNCSHINEPVGLNECTTCKVCNEPEPENDQYRSTWDINNTNETVVPSQGKSFRLDMMADSGERKSKDDFDMNIDSWSELGAALALACSQSVADFALRQANEAQTTSRAAVASVTALAALTSTLEDGRSLAD